MKYSIKFEKNPSASDIQILNDGISHNAKIKKDHKPITFFGFFIRDENGNVVGGCSGDTLYGQLYVGSLWVSEELRNQGYGTQLMELAENYAKEHGCRFISVNTMDFEALDFYKKLVFHVEFERHGFDKDSIFYFLRKDFLL